MNKNVAILFAFMTILLVAALFEGDGTIPAIAEAAGSARSEVYTQDSQQDLAEPGGSAQDTVIAPAVLGPAQSLPPPPQAEPDPPFIQPEPLK